MGSLFDWGEVSWVCLNTAEFSGWTYSCFRVVINFHCVDCSLLDGGLQTDCYVKPTSDYMCNSRCVTDCKLKYSTWSKQIRTDLFYKLPQLNIMLFKSLWCSLRCQSKYHVSFCYNFLNSFLVLLLSRNFTNTIYESKHLLLRPILFSKWC